MDKQKTLNRKISSNLTDNVDLIHHILKDDDTLLTRDFTNQSLSLNFSLLFIDGMINSEVINENIIKPIVDYQFISCPKTYLLGTYLKENVIIVDELEIDDNLDNIIHHLLYGYTILFVDCYDKALIINTKGWKTRTIQEPESETIIEGPREGFNESLMINLTLIRRKVLTPKFKIKILTLGKISQTRISYCYIEDLVNPTVLEAVVKKLESIQVDRILSTQDIEEHIGKRKAAPFKIAESSERPDTVAAKLFEGKIAILSDGSPTVITTPFLFTEYFQTNEDYYNNKMLGSFNRIIRYIGCFLSTSVPAIYIAFVAYHKRLIPTKLLLSILGSRQGVPFPSAVETIFLLFTFEVLREAGVRLPKHVGSAVSIVGALVLGEAAVSASFVSAPIVIIAAVTGISSFLLPKMQIEMIYIRVVLIIFASMLGLYGYILGAIGFIVYICSIEVFGIPYTTFLTDLSYLNTKDIFTRE